jgi:hypothetical protein
MLYPQGALVYGLISSANRDKTQFDAPDRLDLGRQKNRHLAFEYRYVPYRVSPKAAPRNAAICSRVTAADGQ